MVSRDEPASSSTPEPDPDIPSDAAPEPSPDSPHQSAPRSDQTPATDQPPATDGERWADIVADLGSLNDLKLPDPTTARNGRDWDGTEQIDAAEQEVDDQEHFVPPEPPPVLGGDPLLTMAWFAVIGMPVFWLVVLIVWASAPRVLVHASLVVFFAGLAVLFWRMPHQRDPNDDDTGAVV